MKKYFFLLMAVSALLLVVSCSIFGFSSNEPAETPKASKNLIKVTFSEAKAKSLSAEYKNYDVQYLLTATPNFSRSGKTIVGQVVNQTLTDLANGSYNAGYFEQGSWNFKLDAVLAKEGSSNSVLATQTLDSVLINSDHNVVVFSLEDISDGTGTGNVAFSIKVPRLTEDSKASLVVYVDYVNEQSQGKVFTKTNLATDASASDLIEFSGTLDPISSGCHSIKFVYKNGNNEVSSQNVEVRIVKDAEVMISGTMLNGAYVQGNIQVTYVTSKWYLEFEENYEGKEYKVGNAITLKCQAKETTGAKTGPTYQWYKEGTKVPSATDITFNFTPSAPGIYSLTCVGTVDGIAKSISTYIYAK